MTLSAILSYIGSIFARVSWEYWLAMVLFSLLLAVTLLIRKKCSVYGAISIGMAFFAGLIMLNTAVVTRVGDNVNHGIGFSIATEYYQLLQGGFSRQMEMLANVVVFVPFGFFLSEFLSTTKRFRARRQIGRVALAAFVLSLCIESLQLIFRLGVFEITDLVLNTLGGLIGALMSVGVRKGVGERRP